MECPRCGGEMWDNRQNKKNPKAPDFKCKDRECEGAIWPPREKQKPIQERIQPKPQRQDNASDSHKCMLISFAKDLVVAEINRGEPLKDPFKRIVEGYKTLLGAYLGKAQDDFIGPDKEFPIEDED